MCKVIINDEVIDALYLYEIRFVLEEGKHKPVLYHLGKRVIDKYTIIIEHTQPKDEHGRSA